MSVPIRHDRLEHAIVKCLRPAGRQRLIVHDRAEPGFRQYGGDMALHSAIRPIEPEAEGHDDAALQRGQQPA